MNDYRELLIKYIEHVGQCEGVNFIGQNDMSSVNFSKDETGELKKLSWDYREAFEEEE